MNIKINGSIAGKSIKLDIEIDHNATKTAAFLEDLVQQLCGLSIKAEMKALKDNLTK